MSTQRARVVEEDPWPEEPAEKPARARFRLPRLPGLRLPDPGVLWIVPAAALLLAAGGRGAYPIAAWIAPLLLLRFLRSLSPWIGLTAAFLVVVPITASSWWTMVPFAGPARVLVVAAMALGAFLPYLAHRLLAPGVRGWGSTLVFPLAVVAVEFLVASLSPFGTWSTTAYTQAHDLPLMQIASITGIWGVSFLIAWFAAVTSSVWERGANEPRSRMAAIAFVAVMAVAYLMGGARLGRESKQDMVRVASFTVITDPPLVLADLLGNRPEREALEQLQGRLFGLQASLFARAAQEAKAGAQVVFWSEANAIVLKSEEPHFLQEGATVAHDEGVYLGMAFASLVPGEAAYENRFVMLDPEGEIVVDYRRARPHPGARERGADRHLSTVDTPIGRFACAIGSDADFPALMRDAGEARADILLLPASDWPAADPIHTRMALVRGIENGLTVVRQVNRGLSAAADARGRTLASVDHNPTRTTVMICQAPRHGAPTVYARVGDLFPWLCVVALALFVGLAVRAGSAARA